MKILALLSRKVNVDMTCDVDDFGLLENIQLEGLPADVELMRDKVASHLISSSPGNMY